MIDWNRNIENISDKPLDQLTNDDKFGFSLIWWRKHLEDIRSSGEGLDYLISLLNYWISLKVHKSVVLEIYQDEFGIMLITDDTNFNMANIAGSGIATVKCKIAIQIPSDLAVKLFDIIMKGTVKLGYEPTNNKEVGDLWEYPRDAFKVYENKKEGLQIGLLQDAKGRYEIGMGRQRAGVIHNYDLLNQLTKAFSDNLNQALADLSREHILNRLKETGKLETTYKTGKNEYTVAVIKMVG